MNGDYVKVRKCLEANLTSENEARHEDWSSRLALADLCEEAGEGAEADFWRWVAEGRKRPLRMQRDQTVCWFASFTWSTCDLESDLPLPLHSALSGEVDEVGRMKKFKDATSAHDALFKAWVEVMKSPSPVAVS